MKNLRFPILVLLALGAVPVLAADPPKVTPVIGGLLASEGGEFDPQASPLDFPFGAGFDAAGNLYVVEYDGGRVLKQTPAGELSVVAGQKGAKGYSGDGGPAEKATFNAMHNLAVTPAGDLYIADSFNHVVRKIDAKTGMISTFAGTGEAGFSGDGGPANEATFNDIMCVAFNPSQDTLYLADLRNVRIRAIDMKTNLVRTVAGNGKKGIPEDGALAVESPLADPRAVAVDSQGHVYVLERNGNALRVVTPDGRIRTVAGTGKPGDLDGPALQAQLRGPKHLCIGPNDIVFIADDTNAKVRRYDPEAKTVATVLGGADSSIQLNRPHGVWVEEGVLYIVDSGHNRVLRVE